MSILSSSVLSECHSLGPFYKDLKNLTRNTQIVLFRWCSLYNSGLFHPLKRDHRTSKTTLRGSHFKQVSLCYNGLWYITKLDCNSNGSLCELFGHCYTTFKDWCVYKTSVKNRKTKQKCFCIFQFNQNDLYFLVSVPEDFHDILQRYAIRGFRVIAMAWKRLSGKVSWHQVQRMPR